MDRATVGVYESGAAAYLAQREATNAEVAKALADSIPPGHWRVDLGCGPGLYVPHLGAPLVTLDAAHAMLRYVTGAARVQGDLAELPLRDRCLAGAWASNCYQHLAHDELPAALGELHRVTDVGARVVLSLFPGSGTTITGEEDDFPGRRFSLWEPQRLTDVMVGAGFDVAATEVLEGSWRQLRVTARRARSLPDHVGPGMTLLVCGLNPSLYAADRGVNFARPGNRFWPAMLAAGLVNVDRDPRHALVHHGIGMTDLVKRATVAAADVTTAEFVAGVARVERLCAWLQPRALCMVGLSGWRTAVDRKARVGWQPEMLGGVPVYVMPNTSGLNASTQHQGFVDHLLAATSRGSPSTGSGS